MAVQMAKLSHTFAFHLLDAHCRNGNLDRARQGDLSVVLRLQPFDVGSQPVQAGEERKLVDAILVERALQSFPDSIRNDDLVHAF